MLIATTLGTSSMEHEVPQLPYLFAGDRKLAVDALKLLISVGDAPSILCVSDGTRASHAAELEKIFREAGGRYVWSSSELTADALNECLPLEGLDFGLSVHFPHIIEDDLLSVPKRGWLNLHPAYLPWNRGWHTPSWSILEETPAGVSLHRMTPAVDAGDIVARHRIEIDPGDTAHTLYQRLLDEELRLLEGSWETVRSPFWPRISNQADEGTVHRRSELFTEEMQRIDLDKTYHGYELVNKLRALTTNTWGEAAFFEAQGRRYRMRLEIESEKGKGQGC